MCTPQSAVRWAYYLAQCLRSDRRGILVMGGVPFSAERPLRTCGSGNRWSERQRYESYVDSNKRAGILMASYKPGYLQGRVTDLRAAHGRANQKRPLRFEVTRRGTGEMRLKQTGIGEIA